MNVVPFSRRRFLQVLCACFAAIVVVAGIHPVDRSDWFIENLLIFVFIPLLVLTYRRLPLSDVTYGLFFVFLTLHTAGAHYRYADVPLGYWMQHAFGFSRNHFDRIVHLSFGLLLTWPAHEILVRRAKLRGFWAWFLPPVFVVSLSGFFEIIEMLVAMMVSPELGAAYLGIQGDVWDAQKDIGLAIIGSVPPAIISAFVRPAWRREATA